MNFGFFNRIPEQTNVLNFCFPPLNSFRYIFYTAYFTHSQPTSCLHSWSSMLRDISDILPRVYVHNLLFNPQEYQMKHTSQSTSPFYILRSFLLCLQVFSRAFLETSSRNVDRRRSRTYTPIKIYIWDSYNSLVKISIMSY